MRVLSFLVVGALAVANFLVPHQPQPVPRPPDPAAPAPYSVCPLAEAARRSTVLTFVGGDEGGVTASVFSGGQIQANEDAELGAGGTGVVEVSELTGLARSPLLVGLDDPARAVETVLSGDGVAAGTCGPGSPDPQVVLGGSTSEGESYTVVIANPFAGPATVDVLAASEVGTESDPALQGVVVPPRSVVPVELGNLLPGRRAMSAAVVTTRGRVVAGATRQSSSDLSAQAGLEAALDWYVQLPGTEGASRSLVLYSPGTSEIPFQLDVYGDEGVVEAAYEDIVPPRGQVVIPAGDLLDGPGTVRVVAAGPVAAATVFSGETIRAVMPGVSSPSPIWFLPGAGRAGNTRVHVFNPGEVDVTATLQSGPGKEIETVEVPASGSVELALGSRGVGARLEADGDVVVHWTTPAGEALAADAARAPAG